jgi:hypothetical protein
MQQHIPELKDRLRHLEIPWMYNKYYEFHPVHVVALLLCTHTVFILTELRTFCPAGL